jgi:hypothetical protein
VVCLALLWRYCGAMGGGGSRAGSGKWVSWGREGVQSSSSSSSSATDKSTAGGSDGLTAFTHGRRCLARARARASAGAGTGRSGMDDRHPTDQDGQARPRRDQCGSVAALLLDGRSDGDLHYEGVDEGIGSMRDSPGPSMRKTFARPACETALPTFPGQQTACPPQALPPCAARVLPSQYIPPDGKTERRAGNCAVWSWPMCPCVHVWCRAPYVTGRLCRSRAPWVPGPRPAPDLLTRATAKTGERRRSRHAALVLPA